MQAGATIELADGVNIGAKTINPIVGSGVSNNGALKNVSGTNTYGGAITLGTGGARINAAAGGLLNLTNSIVTALGKNLTIGGAGNVTISGVISGAGGLIKDGAGTLTLMATNTYTGSTTINEGKLALGINNALPSTTAVTIGNNATLAAGANTTNSVGTLAVVGNATINLGAGAVLAFANSSTVDWTGGTLNLTGTFVSGASLRFGTTIDGLTSTQLALISSSKFKDFSLNSSGYLEAVEASPGTIITIE